MLQWKELYNKCSGCDECNLCKNRTNVVFGDGNIKADVMFIGEAPGRDEDMTGVPFVGRAGKLLEKALIALDMKRERDYYIANICKCRPKNNRTPNEDEAEKCINYLRNQVALVKPKIIICLGSTAMKYILGKEWKITRDRGKWVERKGVYIMPTFHPAALLRDEGKKKFFWEDLKSLKEKMNKLE